MYNFTFVLIPCKGMNVLLLTKAEYRSKNIETILSTDTIMMHPFTSSSKRYVLGDRFHTARNPNSPHCVNIITLIC